VLKPFPTKEAILSILLLGKIFEKFDLSADAAG
jgi:hypothetical protein